MAWSGLSSLEIFLHQAAMQCRLYMISLWPCKEAFLNLQSTDGCWCLEHNSGTPNVEICSTQGVSKQYISLHDVKDQVCVQAPGSASFGDLGFGANNFPTQPPKTALSAPTRSGNPFADGDDTPKTSQQQPGFGVPAPAFSWSGGKFYQPSSSLKSGIGTFPSLPSGVDWFSSHCAVVLSFTSGVITFASLTSDVKVGSATMCCDEKPQLFDCKP